MDPALLRERERFKKQQSRASVPVEKRKGKSREDNFAKKPKMAPPPKPKVASGPLDYKTAQGSSQYRFSVLAKIVKHMKTRHQQGDTYPLTLEEILDETSQLDVGSSMRHWLQTEALLNNPKITVLEEEGEKKFIFKPIYDIRDKRGLLKLLKNYDLHGSGGILMDEIEESLPNAQKAIKDLGDRVVMVLRPPDKKYILFYNDKYCQFKVDEEFQKLWRSVPVEGLDERKIEDYLEKQGITSMKDLGVRKVIAPKKRKPIRQRKGNFKKHNDHLGGLLEDYSAKNN